MKHAHQACVPEQPLTAEPLLRAIDLECYRGDRLLFREVNLELTAGQALQVHGANGSGKTTLLRILCGLTLPTAGSVHWNGEEVSVGAASRAEEINFIGHANGVKLELSPLENLRVARALMKNPTALPLASALERVNLWGFEDVPAFALSAGQHRRVALARLLLSQARLWVLDEPFTAMDREGIAAIEGMLRGHVEAGGMVVLTSHQAIDLPVESTSELRLAS